MRLQTLREKPQPFFLKFLSALQKRKFGFVLHPTHYWGRMFGNGICFYLLPSPTDAQKISSFSKSTSFSDDTRFTSATL